MTVTGLTGCHINKFIVAETSVAITPSGNGIQLSVKLDAPRKWDTWNREVKGFAIRDRILDHVIRPEGAGEDWYVPVRPRPIDEEAEQTRILAVQDDRSFQMKRDRLNRQLTEYARNVVKYERKVQALGDLLWAMKRSASEMHQDTLNNYSKAYEVYDYLRKAYAPSHTFRIHDTTKQMEWLEKADYFQKGVESWILTWKDLAKKLDDMGITIAADRPWVRFQKANAHIAPETAPFLIPHSLSRTVTAR